MKRPAAALLIALVPMLAMAQAPAPAPAPPPAGARVDAIGKLPGVLWDDTVTLVETPGQWGSNEWSQLALGAAGVVAVGLVLDHKVDQIMVRNQRSAWNQPAKDVAQLGGTGGLILIGAGYVGSNLMDNDEARALWVDAGIATVLSQLAIYPVKMVVGRDRPADGQGTRDFSPFSGNDSFPSGHATQAFAIASVISAHVDSPWAGGAAYGVASLVALSRLYTRDHFSSDVVAGALIGSTIGKAVVQIDTDRRNAPGPHAQLSFSPAWSPDFRGIRMVAKF